MVEIAKQIQAFAPDVKLGRPRNPGELVKEVFVRNPELLYYIARYSLQSRAGQYYLRPEYQNQEYPIDRIFKVKESQIETLLREVVMNYVKKVVLVLPKSANFKWIISCFSEQSISFYPNVRSYQYSSSAFDSVPYTVYEVFFEYRIGTVKLKQMNADVETKVAELKRRLFPIAMPDSAKCFIAHNYLASTIDYFNVDEGNPLEKSYVQSAYGGLIRGKCVCQGFAEAYKRLLDSVGIPCDLVSGRVMKEEDGWHAWNIIHLNHNSLHTHVDVTWDSKKRNVSTKYFGKSDTFFLEKREWDRFYYTPCSDGEQVLLEARKFCRDHRKELLACGLQKEWIDA